MRYCDENHSSFANNPATRFRPTDDKKNVTSSPTGIRHRYFPQPSAPPSRHHLHSEEITMADISSTISNEQKKKEKKNGLRRFFFSDNTKAVHDIDETKERRGERSDDANAKHSNEISIHNLEVIGRRYGRSIQRPLPLYDRERPFQGCAKNASETNLAGERGGRAVEKSEGLLAGVLQ